MLLDRIDIDAHGPLNRVELGPFSEHLNVICGPEGSGKTAIARFIRDSLVQREYPLGMMSSSTGRVVWADREGMLHCRREKDGTKTGRRTIEFEPRGDFSSRYDSLHRSWIDASRSSDASRAMQSIQIPEAIVDGVVTDTAVTSVARVVSACVRSGLDRREIYQTTQSPSLAAEGKDDLQRRELRAQLAEVEAELARIQLTRESREALIRRRDELASRFGNPSPQKFVHATSDARIHELNVQLAELENRANVLRARQSEFRRCLADLDAETPRTALAPTSRISDEELRRSLDDLDAQMIRWRRTLTEVRGLRDALTNYRGIQNQPESLDPSWRRRELENILHSANSYAPSYSAGSWIPGTYATPTFHWNSQDINSRIDSATRQIDWLLNRYTANDFVADWYQAVPRTGVSSSLADSLRAIRKELDEVRGIASSAMHVTRYDEVVDTTREREVEELRQSEQWLATSINQLIRRREELLRGYAPELSNSGQVNSGWTSEYIQREKARRIEDLNRVELDLNDCVSRAAQLRRQIQQFSDVGVYQQDSANWVDDRAINEEIRDIDAQLTAHSRADWLRRRRQQLIDQLGVARNHFATESPLAEEASRWLVRLSAGRLRSVTWPYAAFKSASLAHSIHLDDQRSGVCIDGQDESMCGAADRALAVMAVRLAAGEILAKTGRPVPLVLELNRELLQDADMRHDVYDAGDAFRTAHASRDGLGRFNHPVAAALQDYAQRGQQIVLLTSSQDIASQIQRAGGSAFNLYPTQTVHAHRPVWRPHFATERYVGPHPQVYDRNVAPDYRVAGDVVERPVRTRRPVAFSPAWTSTDINRSFDTAWREAYGFYDNPERNHDYPATDWAIDGEDYRDGYYVANSFTTQQRPRKSAPQLYVKTDEHSGLVPLQMRTNEVEKRSPFFLSVDSPIDQAPSIDAVAAARLRGLSVTHINHLMQKDSNRLADALGLANVDAATVRRWKAECRLVCRVPQLRGFDARVLVGCGVTDPAQLASTPPGELLQRVEDFLASKRGQQILLSGSSYELSRITSWIAAARSATAGRVLYHTDSESNRRTVDGRVIDDSNPLYAFDSDRYEYDNDNNRVRVSRGNSRNRNGAKRTRSRSNRSRSNGYAANSGHSNGYGIMGDANGAGVGNGSGIGNGSGNGSGTGNGYANGAGNGSGSGSGHGSGSGRGNGYGNGSGSGRGSGSSRRSRKSRSSSSRGDRPDRPVVRISDRESREYDREPRDYERTSRDYDRESRRSQSRSNRSSRSEREPREDRERDSERELRFYLHRSSPVVDAPSIGSRMGAKLNEIGIYTVDDLLNADPQTLADQLNHRRTDASVVLAWQQQATLVCRIPMIRGHDAQLLVAADVTTPEEVAESDADELFGLIDPISRSNEGKRIIRGGKLPDLEEITEWIDMAKQNRDLMAA